MRAAVGVDYQHSMKVTASPHFFFYYSQEVACSISKPLDTPTVMIDSVEANEKGRKCCCLFLKIGKVSPLLCNIISNQFSICGTADLTPTRN